MVGETIDATAEMDVVIFFGNGLFLEDAAAEDAISEAAAADAAAEDAAAEERSAALLDKLWTTADNFVGFDDDDDEGIEDEATDAVVTAAAAASIVVLLIGVEADAAAIEPAEEKVAGIDAETDGVNPRAASIDALDAAVAVGATPLETTPTPLPAPLSATFGGEPTAVAV